MIKKNKRFCLGLLIYALVYCIIAAIGMTVFWQFIAAYEISRPKTAVNEYIASVSDEDIRAGSESLLVSLDKNIQTEDQAFAIIKDSIAQGITAAKSGKQSTPERAVYMLRSGGQTIGTVAIIPGEEGKFGFTPWRVADASFDFSWLKSQGISITVPAAYCVSLNGNPLDERYMIESGIAYPVLQDFQGDFDMPVLVTYGAGDFLGEFTFSVTDPEGNPVQITADTDRNSMLPRCTAEEESQIQQLTTDYLTAYINYTGSANRMAYANLKKLKQYVVRDSALATRLSAAFGGLVYAQSNGDEITSMTFNGMYNVSEDRYCCDVSYVLKTIGHNGAVETNNSTRLILLRTEEGLKVEAMANY